MNPSHSGTPQQRYRARREVAGQRRKAFGEAPVPKIHIGMATCGIAAGALDTKQAFEEALAESGL
ncbi:MAG: hypothetical protein JSW39_08155, partial [Desulfobacterales bacterium]